jgi:hypothetical protein
MSYSDDILERRSIAAIGKLQELGLDPDLVFGNDGAEDMDSGEVSLRGGRPFARPNDYGRSAEEILDIIESTDDVQELRAKLYPSDKTE